MPEYFRKAHHAGQRHRASRRTLLHPPTAFAGGLELPSHSNQLNLPRPVRAPRLEAGAHVPLKATLQQ
jgi:hypothetical protein